MAVEATTDLTMDTTLYRPSRKSSPDAAHEEQLGKLLAGHNPRF